MIRHVPTINTARLTLRAMRPEDFERYAEIWTLPQVVRHISAKPRSRSESWGHFLRNAGHWEMTGYGQWGIAAQNDRRLVGQTGFFHGGRDLGDDFDPFPEAGWVLAPEAQGRGIGWEATQAAHDWFDRVIPGPLVAQIASDNAASLRLAWKLGYQPMREVPGQNDCVVLMRRDGPPGGR